MCSSDSLSIRAAQPGDAPLILQFIIELARYERLEHEAIGTVNDLLRWLFSPDRVAESLIAELDGEPVGFALFFRTFSTFLAQPGMYLEDLFVRPMARGRGVGEALLRHVAALAVERGCGRLEWAVLDWNESALRFYRRLGAKAMDQWTTHRVMGSSLQNLAEGGRMDTGTAEFS